MIETSTDLPVLHESIVVLPSPPDTMVPLDCLNLPLDELAIPDESAVQRRSRVTPFVSVFVIPEPPFDALVFMVIIHEGRGHEIFRPKVFRQGREHLVDELAGHSLVDLLAVHGYSQVGALIAQLRAVTALTVSFCPGRKSTFCGPPSAC